MSQEEYAERVLDLVAQIPEGRVVAYGDIARMLGEGGPRNVGAVMSRYGSDVPWWRVIRADGRPARGLEESALDRLRTEGCPIRADRVQIARARWVPTSRSTALDGP